MASDTDNAECVAMLKVGLRVREAAENGDATEVAALIEAAPWAAHEKDLHRWTPLMRASARGHADVVEALLKVLKCGMLSLY